MNFKIFIACYLTLMLTAIAVIASDGHMTPSELKLKCQERQLWLLKAKVYEDIVERITEAAAFGARGLSLFEAEDASEGYATFINPGDLVDGLAEVCVNIGHWIDWDNLAERLEKEKLTVLWIRMVDEGIDVIDAIIWVEEKEGKLS